MINSFLKENSLGKPVDFADEDNKSFHLTIQASGVKKKDVKVSVEGRCVRVKDNHSLNYYFTAPVEIKPHGISTHLEDSTLYVSILKE